MHHGWALLPVLVLVQMQVLVLVPVLVLFEIH
jgi:hypothetical protein